MAISNLSNNHRPQPDGDNHPEQLLYLTVDEMSKNENDALLKHLATCQQCRLIRESVLSTRTQILASLDSETQSTLPIVPSESKPLRLIRRISTVAALLLILIFIAEQARSVQQISNLEKRLSKIEHPGTPPLIDQWTLYRVGQNWQDLAARYELPETQLTNLASLNPIKLAEYQEVIKRLIRLEITRRQSMPKTENLPFPNPK